VGVASLLLARRILRRGRSPFLVKGPVRAALSEPAAAG